jgi:hypothetical protein
MLHEWHGGPRRLGCKRCWRAGESRWRYVPGCSSTECATIKLIRWLYHSASGSSPRKHTLFSGHA